MHGHPSALAICMGKDWRLPLRSRFGTTVMHHSRQLCHRCQETSRGRWRTLTTIVCQVRGWSTSRRVFNFSLQFWMNLMRSCSGINGLFDDLYDHATYSMHCRIFLRSLLALYRIFLGYNWFGDATPVSFTSAVSIRFPLYDHFEWRAARRFGAVNRA